MGVGGAGLETAPTAKKTVEVLIDGKYYDITDFKHPGGSVIRFYDGGDASAAFHEFHLRSKKATKMLKNLPSREATGKQDRLLQDFEAFRNQLEKEGLYDPSIPHVVYRVSELVALHVLGAWLVAQGWWFLGLSVLGIAQGRCGWVMHEGGHHSLTGIIKLDIFLQRLIYGMGCGMSASWWRVQHNKHHATPQRLGYDVDLDTLPLVAFAKGIITMRPKLANPIWLRLQHFLFAPVTTFLVGFGWQFFLHPRHIVRTKQAMEAFWILLRLAIWAYAGSQFGYWLAFKAYCFYVWVGAMYIFMNFAVSHTHLPTLPKEQGTDWLRYAANHTMNVYPGPFGWVNWWMGYLNFQIEHHLFPCMPQFRQPSISPRVEKFFKDHNLPYMRQSYFKAMAMTFANLHKVGQDAFYG